MHTVSLNFLITYKKRLPFLSILGLPFIHLPFLLASVENEDTQRTPYAKPSVWRCSRHQDRISFSFSHYDYDIFLLNLWNPTSNDYFSFLLQCHPISLGVCSFGVFVTCRYVAGTPPRILRYRRQLSFNAADKLSRRIWCCCSTEDGLPPNSSSFFRCERLLRHPCRGTLFPVMKPERGDC